MPIKLDPPGSTVKQLLVDIEEFMTMNNMDNDGNYFGWLAIKDRTVVQRLRDGGDVGTTKMDTIYAFMQNPVDHYRAKTSVRGLARIEAFQPFIKQPRSTL